MATWTLVPCLVSLDAEFDQLAPDRDHSSDGSIGDQAHKERSSSHNIDDGPAQGATPNEDADSRPEVHAIDVDADLRRPGWTMQAAVNLIVARHRSGLDDRLQNVIFNRKIYSRSWGWGERDYTGSNPHDKHAHFESRYGTDQENDTRPWGLLELEDDMFDEVLAGIDRALTNDPKATKVDRVNRDRFARLIRFSLGLEVDEQTTEALPCGTRGALARIETKLVDG